MACTHNAVGFKLRQENNSPSNKEKGDNQNPRSPSQDMEKNRGDEEKKKDSPQKFTRDHIRYVFSQTVAVLAAYVEERKIESVNDLTRKKAKTVEDSLQDIREAKTAIYESDFTEESLKNNDNPVIGLIYFLFLLIRNHQIVLSEAFQDMNRKHLWENFSSIINSLLDRPFRYAGNFFFPGELTPTLDHLVNIISTNFPKETETAMQVISAADAEEKRKHNEALKAKQIAQTEEAKIQFFPKLINWLDYYLRETKDLIDDLKKNDTLTNGKYKIALELKEGLSKEIEKKSHLEEKKKADSLDGQATPLNRSIKLILDAKEKHQQLTSAVIPASARERLGETVGGIMNYCLNRLLIWAGSSLYHGRFGAQLDIIIKLMETLFSPEVAAVRAPSVDAASLLAASEGERPRTARI